MQSLTHTGSLATVLPAMAHIHEKIDIRWCSDAELDTLQPPMSNAVKWYCRKALEEITGCRTRNAERPPTMV